MHSATNTWKEFFPAIELPESQSRIWATLHTPPVVESSIAQLAVKYRKLGEKMDLDYMVRFASAVMNRLDPRSDQQQIATSGIGARR
jgi:hypothetical protein